MERGFFVPRQHVPCSVVLVTVCQDNREAGVLGKVQDGGRGIAICMLAAMALVAMLNAYTYSYATGIPLVQSDAWIFLDTYVRKYLEDGFGWRDLFLQAHASDTNLPLHKLVLLFHINHFRMDFKVEALVGVLSGIALVVLLTMAAAGRRPAHWGLSGFALLAGLALTTLSLNSSNIYTWPLATMWFLNILIVAIYLVVVVSRPAGVAVAGMASFGLGILVDEVAIVAVLAAAAALMVVGDWRLWRPSARRATAAFTGLFAARLLYAWFNSANGVLPDPGMGAGISGGAVHAWRTGGINVVLVPLADSLVHTHVLQEVFPSSHRVASSMIGSALLVAHAWFWWTVLFWRPATYGRSLAIRRLAVALMLLFYGTVAGIVLQRVPVFGIDYLHQPRYVLFYQLNLAALGLMVYAIAATGTVTPSHRRSFGGLAAMVLVALALLQWQLGVRSWQQAKYLSAYMEGAAYTLGRLAIDPGADIPCADILRICDFPPAQRQRMMELLLNYQLNLFNPDFQSLYRLRPFPPPDAARTQSISEAKTAAGQESIVVPDVVVFRE